MRAEDSITQLLLAWGQGDSAALEELTPRVHRELYAIARAYLSRGRPNQTLQPTALINEAFLRLIEDPHQLRYENRAHFFGISARIMRLVLVDYARAHRAGKRGGGVRAITLGDSQALAAPASSPDVIEVHEALEKLAQVDERKAKVIELRYFGGLSREEVAEALGLTVSTVKRDLRLGEAWLRRFLSAAAPEKTTSSN